MIVVMVHDLKSAYAYGPFKSHDEAQAFVEKHEKDFFGHTLSTSRIISPTVE